jgi:tetratricopeptide (TPR) repeat protein
MIMRTKGQIPFVITMAFSFCTIAGCGVGPTEVDHKAWESCERGYKAADSGNFAGAAHYFDEAVRLDPKAAWVYHARAENYVKLGEYDKAITDCTEAILLRKYNCDGARYCMTRAKAHEKKGDYDKTIADYTEAIRLRPKYASDRSACYLGRGRAYEKNGEKSKAEADFSEAGKQKPGFGEE